MEYTMKRAICFNDENNKFITLSRGAHVRDENNSFVINDEYVTSHFGMFRNDASAQHIISSTDLIEDYDIEAIRALKFTCDDTVTFNILHKIGHVYDLQYSFDGYNWQQLIDDGDANEFDFIPYNVITLNADETLYLRGNNSRGFDYIADEEMCAIWFEIQGDGNVSCTGNIMHLLSYETDMTEIPCEGCFAALFSDCENLVSAPALPAMTLTDNCYASMFFGCTNLTDAPELPATTLSERCYESMFGYCESLVNAPELPATTLANTCYQRMFRNCGNLVNAPALPATTLNEYCYINMFWLCTNLVNAPELPATTLANSCYIGMFDGCANLQTITCLYENDDLFNYTHNWMRGVSNDGTFYTCANPQYDTTKTGVKYIPEGWNVVTKNV